MELPQYADIVDHQMDDGLWEQHAADDTGVDIRIYQGTADRALIYKEILNVEKSIYFMHQHIRETVPRANAMYQSLREDLDNHRRRRDPIRRRVKIIRRCYCLTGTFLTVFLILLVFYFALTKQ